MSENNNTTAKDHISKSELQVMRQDAEDSLRKAMDQYLKYWNVSSFMMMAANAVLKNETSYDAD